MFFDYLNQYFQTLVNTMDFPSEGLNNGVGLISMLLAYIPIHFLIKPLIGEKNATFALLAYLATVFVTITSAFIGG